VGQHENFKKMRIRPSSSKGIHIAVSCGNPFLLLGLFPNKRQEIPCALFDRTTTMRRSNADCKRTRECSRVMFAHSVSNLPRLIPSSRSTSHAKKISQQNLSSFGAKPLKMYRERDFKTRAPHERATRDDAIRALIRALKKVLNATTHHFCCFACVFLKAV
jgi:hypothetical protein